MTEERLTDLVIQITSGIAELNANMKTALGKLADHERRIDDLEKNKLGIKDTLIQWLVKGIVLKVYLVKSVCRQVIRCCWNAQLRARTN